MLLLQRCFAQANGFSVCFANAFFTGGGTLNSFWLQSILGPKKGSVSFFSYFCAMIFFWILLYINQLNSASSPARLSRARGYIFLKRMLRAVIYWTYIMNLTSQGVNLSKLIPWTLIPRVQFFVTLKIWNSKLASLFSVLCTEKEVIFFFWLLEIARNFQETKKHV